MTEIRAGKCYFNGRGDMCGPMRLVVEPSGRRVWLDQYGGLYEDNGFQVNHVIGSTANLDLSEAYDDTDERFLDEKYK